MKKQPRKNNPLFDALSRDLLRAKLRTVKHQEQTLKDLRQELRDFIQRKPR